MSFEEEEIAVHVNVRAGLAGREAGVHTGMQRDCFGLSPVCALWWTRIRII